MDKRILSLNIAFDITWAHMQAKRWRTRAIDRRIPVEHIDHEEVVSIIAELWWRIASGETGNFQASHASCCEEELRAYVAGCIDNEMLRSMRRENAPGGIALPKGGKISFDFCPEPQDGEIDELSAQESIDPLTELCDRENVDVHTWAGQLGSTIEHYLDRARSMTVRESRPLRSQVREKNKLTRPNTAWAVVMAANEHDNANARKLAPMLMARWVDQFGGSIMELRSSTYPYLDKDPEKTRLIAANEARSLLRWLARVSGNETGVTSAHLDLVARDASSAMMGWVGKRGPYKKTKTRNKLERDFLAA